MPFTSFELLEYNPANFLSVRLDLNLMLILESDLPGFNLPCSISVHSLKEHGSLLIRLKTSENQSFPDVFKGIKRKHVHPST